MFGFTYMKDFMFNRK